MAAHIPILYMRSHSVTLHLPTFQVYLISSAIFLPVTHFHKSLSHFFTEFTHHLYNCEKLGIISKLRLQLLLSSWFSPSFSAEQPKD